MGIVNRQAAPGDVIGSRYRIDGWLGQGNMAAVFRATHLGTKQLCALKLIHPHLVTQVEVREMFVREAQVGARIGSNPHIVNVFDAGIDALFDVPFLTMELLEGQTLDGYIQTNGAMPPGLLRTLLLQLADALDQAHSVGVVHRDLKPGNLFLTYDRRKSPVLKVVDFGIAKIMEQGARGTATQVGSPAYAAPEQVAAPMLSIVQKLGINIAPTISPATDIWAFGIIAYELLVGALPGQFWTGSERPNISEVVAHVVVKPTPKASEQANEKAHLLPRNFDEWLDRCLRKDATERWPSANDAALALADLLDTGFDEGGTAKMNPRILDDVAKNVARHTALIGSAKPTPNLCISSPPVAPNKLLPTPEKISTNGPPATSPAIVETLYDLDFDEVLLEPAQTAVTDTFTNSGARDLNRNEQVHANTAHLPPPILGVAERRPTLSGSNQPPIRLPPPPPPRSSMASLPPPNPPPPTAPPAPQTPELHPLRHNPADASVGRSAPASPAPQEAGGTSRGIATTNPTFERISGNRLVLVVTGIAVIITVGAMVVRALPKDGRIFIHATSATNGMEIEAVEVFVDGKKHCDFTPCTVQDVTPGEHNVSIVPHEGIVPPRQTTVLNPRSQVTINFSVNPVPPTPIVSALPTEKRSLSIDELETTSKEKAKPKPVVKKNPLSNASNDPIPSSSAAPQNDSDHTSIPWLP